MREQVFTPLRIVYKNQLKSIVGLAIFTRFKQTNYFQIFSVGSFAEKKMFCQPVRVISLQIRNFLYE